MRTEHYTLALLYVRDDAPELTEQEADALQDAHMAHLSALHDRGDLLAAGPVLGSPERPLRGFAIYRGGVDEVRTLTATDPGVQGGRYRSELHSWMTPAGLIGFRHGRLPASMAEATARRPA